jgi:hypothetical protein
MEDYEVDEQYLSACHRAGHIVAVMTAGGSEFMTACGSELLSLTIEPPADGLGCAQYQRMSWDPAFIAFAGPWAEGRSLWPLQSLDGEDEEDLVFFDYVGGALLRRNDDGAEYRRGTEMDAAVHGANVHLLERREDAWHEALEECWPVIQDVASRLLRGDKVTTTTVAALLAPTNHD